MIRSSFFPRFTLPATYSSLDMVLSTSKLQEADYEPHGLFSPICHIHIIGILTLFWLMLHDPPILGFPVH
eukprot:snap_masked-scaffold_57-processed-gene-0.16-mRNA-1 protein AED:1.00 eAED:1.00 QI:0/0/0/0/1/1/2/0/69